jgi:predicted NAD/FAD-binding protein
VEEAGLTIGGLLTKLGLGSWFRDHYLLPLSGAIWSTPKDRILDFPAACNGHLLSQPRAFCTTRASTSGIRSRAGRSNMSQS